MEWSELIPSKMFAFSTKGNNVDDTRKKSSLARLVPPNCLQEYLFAFGFKKRKMSTKPKFSMQDKRYFLAFILFSVV